MKCPKCGGNMIKGARVDLSYGATVRESWVPEEYFQGKKSVRDFLLRKWKKQGRLVESFCCERCGYIESYAKKK